MTTRLGRTIRATANHKFLTMQGWQRLDELTTEMHLALPRRLPGPAQATMSDGELALLGHLIGDGCTLPTHAIQYTTHELELAETVASLATSVFGDDVEPRIKQERDWYQVYLPPGKHIRLTHNVHNPVTDWLRKLGVSGLRSYEKFVPEQVFAQPAEGIAKFLRHLWSTDGCIHLSIGKIHSIKVYYASNSERLARDVQSLLLRLGINATILRYPQVGKGQDQYHVKVSGKDDIECFFLLIGGLGKKKVAHQANISAYLADIVAKTNRDVLPSSIWSTTILPAIQAAGLTKMTAGKALGYASPIHRLTQQNLSREQASRIAQILQSEELTRLAQSDVYWDQILSVDAEGEEEVYDLTVDGLHNFVTDNFNLHNSIEQDSDIVMFIYRDDVYNQESERKNIADVIVAKHRNGP
ncbi:MAG: LAGLIDADG family homing endonuclease, partial [Ktedonobacteraceae bacterium]